MTPSSTCIALVKEFEGLRLTAYKDAAGFKTIGWGHKIGLHDSTPDVIDEAQAEGLLLADLTYAGKCVESLVKVPLTQSQFDALTSWTFNLGPERLQESTLLRRLNAGNYLAVPDEMERWTMTGGVRLAGLVRRRNAEADLWNKG